MSEGIVTHNSFKNHIRKAVIAMKTKDLVSAEEYIKHAMLENCHAPEVHNLLGILAEINGDRSLAGKHYRAAYALDPTYKPASRNLDRLTSFFYHKSNINFDFGEKPEEEEMSPYILQYDDKNVGHLIKRKQVK